MATMVAGPNFVLVYLNDRLIESENSEEHKNHVRTTQKKNNNMDLNWDQRNVNSA